MADNPTYQVARPSLIALLGSLLFLTAAMGNPYRGGFSVDASTFASVLCSTRWSIISRGSPDIVCWMV